MKTTMSSTLLLAALLLIPGCASRGAIKAGEPAPADSITATFVDAKLDAPAIDARLWRKQPSAEIVLMAQPMVAPRPVETRTEKIHVQAVHNGEWIAFRLRWADPQKSEAGPVGAYSDAVALQFPGNGESLPMAFMGNEGSPVHILHWRAQFQRDQEKGPQTIRDIYPNMSVDMYPFQFADHGNLPAYTEADRAMFQPAKAAGNPVAFTKTSGVAELIAEGFGTSAAIPGGQALSAAQWHKGEWTVVIARPLTRENASVLQPGTEGNIAFAVWQGGDSEVGSRKSLTMSWVPLILEPAH